MEVNNRYPPYLSFVSAACVPYSIEEVSENELTATFSGGSRRHRETFFFPELGTNLRLSYRTKKKIRITLV